MKDQEWEKFKNFVLYKIWATDKEVDELLPGIVIYLMILAIVLFIICLIFR